MAKSKKVRISNNKIESIIKAQCSETDVSWNDIEFTVKNSVPLKSILEIAHNASSNVFSESGVYAPEGGVILMRCGILEHYTNLELPDSLEARYDFVMRTDIIPAVTAFIDGEQLRLLEEAVEERIAHKRDVEVKGVERRVQEAAKALDESVAKIAGVFEGFGKEDMARMLSAIEGGKLDEEKLVRAYMANKS